MSQLKKILSLAVVIIMAFSVVGIATEEVTSSPTTIYTNGTDGTNWGDNYAYINTLTLLGAEVKSYEWDANNCKVKLSEDTPDDAEIELSFSVAGSFSSAFSTATLNGTNIKSAKKGTLVLESGKGTAEIYFKGIRSGMAKTISIEVTSTEPPVCTMTEDNKEAYCGLETTIELEQYFTGAEIYYLVNENGKKEEVDGGKYSFTPFEEGSYILTFSASNEIGGDCPDTVTVTVTATAIENGIWIRNKTSNGSLDYVTFTGENDNVIEGIETSIEGTAITVILPRTVEMGSKIKASFSLSQTDGLPFISASNAFNQGKGSITQYTSTISSGSVTKTLYLYNSVPKAVSNTYTTYTVNYIIENEIPTLSEGQEENASAEINAGAAYTLDLSSVFSDADGDELTYIVEINGEEAVSADKNFSFMPTIGGTYTLRFFAKDFIAQSEDSYTVTLNVTNSAVTYDMTVMLPSDIVPAFYITDGYDENGVDILGTILTSVAGEEAGGYVSYSVSVPENISSISVRDASYGGMTITAANGSTVKLSKVHADIIDLGDRAVSGNVTVSYGTYKASGVENKFLLETEKEYTFTAIPSDSSTYNSANEPLTLSEDKDTVALKVSYKNPKTIIATTGADVKLFKFANNYHIHTVYAPLATVDNADGTSTYYFAADGSLSYRVSMDGRITKAGYLTRNSETVLYTEEDALPTDRVNYATAGTDASTVADDSLLLNINQKNHLSLSVGQTKTLKAYRAWEIVNNATMNNIIQPDFNYNIISGEDVVSLTPYENQPMTNSSGNWRTLTAIGEGTAVIEVTYDSIMIDGSSYSGFYGATDPARTGLFVVTVGEGVPDVDFGIECKTGAGSVVYNEANAKPWDSEFDTLYFFGESGEIKFSPTVENANITEVAISSDKGANYTVLEETDGIYTAPVMSGNNIIRVTTDNGAAYQIVRGDKIELSVKNLTNPDNPVAAGDKISLKLVGLHTPIPKISGTFNPGYSGNTDGDSKAHIRYSFGEETIISTGKQYDFALNGTTMEFTVPSDCEETEFTLADGYIAVGVIGVAGFSDDTNTHRNIPDGGGNTRDTKTTFTTRSLLPDITVSIGMLPSDNTAPFIRETAPKTATLNLGGTYAISMTKIFTDRDGDAMTYTAKVGEGDSSQIEAYYTFTPDAVGTYTIVFTANDGKAEGVSHTITLTVKERETSSSKPSLEFDIEDDEIAGFVKISFTDKGKRVEGEDNISYPNALGTIISSTQVPFKEGDTVADVTLRFLDAKEFTYQYTGNTKEGFYLSSIGDFEHKGIEYDSFGEFDAGSGSGWMITLNKTFIKYGASEFEVANGDVIKWQYTCQLGADIGDDFYNDRTPSTKKEEKKEEPEATVFTETTFTDVKKNDWHYESVKYVYENNLMQGTGAGFEPDSKMSRAMLVTVLYRMANPDKKSAEHNFMDVPANEWYSEAIAWASESGIVNGINQTQFAPSSDVSREQMAVIIYRFAKIMGYDVSDKADISTFADTNDISDFAFDAVAWANKKEIVNGTIDKTLSPKDTATRAQVATILMRFCENIAK